jgi:XTP/dITP diphosphohydrolase
MRRGGSSGILLWMVTGPRVFYRADHSLYVATSNPGKLTEFRRAANQYGIGIETLPDLATISAPEENGATFDENARIKAAAYSLHAPGRLVFGDDSGLEVDALDGAPGVYSARYAATFDDPDPSDEDNNYKLIYELERRHATERSARFVCVIAIAKDGEVLATFRGSIEGEILLAPLGHGGFGYDPLFYVPRLRKTMAELEADEKTAISHRGQAFRELLAWVRALPTNPSSL